MLFVMMVSQMSKVIVLQHVGHEGPGRILPVFQDFGIPVEIRRLHQGDAVPTDPDQIRALIVMGGPMGVDDVGSERYPFLADEVALLRRMIELDRPVLGICLGAQLLAHAAGAKVYPNMRPAVGEAPVEPAPEMGWGPVNFPFPGGTEPIVYGAYDGTMMFHWHFDTFDLPRLAAPANAAPPPAPAPPTGNALLSSTRLCKNQAFRFKTRLFGFQYHFEMTPDGIEAMLDAARDDWQKVLGPQGAEQIRRDSQLFYPRYERLGNKLLGNLVQFLHLYRS